MRLSLDLDGSVWSHKALFRVLMQAFQSYGHEVGILTAHRDIHRDADLLMLEREGFPKPDFFLCRPYKSAETYAEFKAKAILANDISYAFDDCNFQSAECEAAMRALLGAESHRLIKVTPRFPEAQRYE